MLSGEVAVGHSYVPGGDFSDITEGARAGLLGVDLEEELSLNLQTDFRDLEAFFRLATA